MSLDLKTRFVVPRLVLSLAMLLEFATLAATLWGWWLLRERTIDEDLAHFENLREHALTEIEVRLQSYENALWGGAGLWNASKKVTRSDWESYATTLQLDNRFPGMLGIGYIHRVQNNNLPTFISQEQTDNYPDFSVTRVPYGDVKADDQLIIAYVVPVDRNMKAIGLDIGSEINRRAAAEEAAQINEARITGIIQLVQDQKATPGYLLLVPISSSRKDGGIINSWVYAPIIGRQIFGKIADAKDSEIRFTVYDGDPQNKQIVVDSHSEISKKFPILANLRPNYMRADLGLLSGNQPPILSPPIKASRHHYSF